MWQITTGQSLGIELLLPSLILPTQMTELYLSSGSVMQEQYIDRTTCFQIAGQSNILGKENAKPNIFRL